jgi:hypothetical protein
MHLRYDQLYLYRGFHGCPAYCWLRIYTTPGQSVVLATEMHENPGTSITNAAERLAMEVTRTFRLSFDALTWIEHYPERLCRHGRPGLPASFDLVTFTRSAQGLQSPEWRRLSQAQVEAMLGQPLPPWLWGETRCSQRQEVP